jgi:uncharacterized membrane protein YqaE (UPF0057 family)
VPKAGITKADTALSLLVLPWTLIASLQRSTSLLVAIMVMPFYSLLWVLFYHLSVITSRFSPFLTILTLILAVAARFGIGKDFWLNLLLTVCGYIPGMFLPFSSCTLSRTAALRTWAQFLYTGNVLIPIFSLTPLTRTRMSVTTRPMRALQSGLHDTVL